MDFACPSCGGHVSIVLVGSDERRYVKCLECGETELMEPANTPPSPESPAQATVISLRQPR